MAQFWQIDSEEASMDKRPEILVNVIPYSALVLLVILVLKLILQIMVEGKAYFESFGNVIDVVAYILVIRCQVYYWTGNRQYGNFIPEEDSYFEVFLLPMILMLHLILIFQYLIAFKNFRFFIIMIAETMHKALLFY